VSEYQNKVVWITGGGSGIGRAMALEFARQGADVAVSGRRKDRLQSVADEITALGRRGLAVVCDVSDEPAVQATVATVVAELGRLDVAVANAGFAVAGPFERLTAEDWRRQFDVNVVGAAVTIAQALPELKKVAGRAVLVSSVAGMISAPRHAAYNASKYAVRAMGQTLSAELAGSGVTCTTVCPGFVESEIAQVDNQGRFDGDREDKRPQKLMWPADKAAQVTVRAITARKREFVFTWHGKFGGWLGRHMPGMVHAVFARGEAKKAAARAAR
jgi:NAD(P)-dependent dehydrogenase (short-subunit alcohol dehydrogenase family)